MASVICEIPIDLFISRKRRLGFTHGDLTFTDGSGKLIFRLVDNRSSSSSSSSSTTTTTKTKSKRSPRVFQLLDDKGNPLFSISRNDVGWQGCRGDGKYVIFEAKKTLQSFWRREVEVFLGSDSSGGFNSILKMRGFPFQRSCTIYEGNSIVGQIAGFHVLPEFLTRNPPTLVVQEDTDCGFYVLDLPTTVKGLLTIFCRMLRELKTTSQVKRKKFFHK